MQQTSDQKSLDALMEDYNKEVAKLWDSLMGLEMLLVDQLEVQ